MMTKLAKKAKKLGHSASKPARRLFPRVVGSYRFKTSSVMGKANMPSLKASSRSVSRSEAFSFKNQSP